MKHFERLILRCTLCALLCLLFAVMFSFCYTAVNSSANSSAGNANSADSNADWEGSSANSADSNADWESSSANSADNNADWEGSSANSADNNADWEGSSANSAGSSKSLSAKQTVEEQAGLTTITLMHCYDPGTYLKTTHQVFSQRKEEWLKLHPEVQLKETVIRVEDYGSEISYYASQDALSDIFLIGRDSVPLWVKWELLAETTDLIGSAVLTDTRMEPFLHEGRAYTFPAITDSPILIAYDKNAWENAGYAEFPQTWEELEDANDVFRKSGYSSVLAFPDINGSNLTTYLMSRIFAENCGFGWQAEVGSGTGKAVFIRNGVLSAIEEAVQIAESDLFTSAADPVSLYMEGKCPSAILSTDSIPALQEDPDKWAVTAFSLLPVSIASSYHDSVNSTFYGLLSYAPAVSAKVSEDPEKLALCMDFCSYVSGLNFPAMNDSNADLTVAHDFKLNSSAMNDSLLHHSVRGESVRNFVYYLPSAATVSTPLETLINGQKPYTAAEIRNQMQDQFEKARNKNSTAK